MSRTFLDKISRIISLMFTRAGKWKKKISPSNFNLFPPQPPTQRKRKEIGKKLQVGGIHQNLEVTGICEINTNLKVQI